MQKKKSKKAVFNPALYAKNVLKSAGYIGAKTFEGVDSELYGFIKESKNDAKELYSNVRNFKSIAKNKIDEILGDTGFDDLRQLKKDAIDDLKTGKFYNKERTGANENKLMEQMGLNFDFDDEDTDEGSSNKSSRKSSSSMVDDITSKSGGDDFSSSRITKNARVNTRANMAFNEKMFGRTNSSLSVINGSILNLHKDLTEPLNTHIINSSNFYQVATTELAKQTNLLENINNMLTERFAPPKKGFGVKSSAFEQVFGSGFPNFKEAMKIAKNRTLSALDVEELAGFLNPEMIKIFLSGDEASSPIAAILSAILAGKIKNSKSGRLLNRTSDIIKGGFIQTAAKISSYAKMSRNSFTLPAILSRMFDFVPEEGKIKPDFSKYNKGREDWNGKDAKALQVVIPTYLSKISAVLTGEEQQVFDYNSGKFITVRAAKERTKEERTAIIGSSSKRLKSKIIDEFIEEDLKNPDNAEKIRYTKNSRKIRNLSKDYDKLISMLTLSKIDMAKEFTKKNSIVEYCDRRGWFRQGILDKNNIRIIDTMIFKNGWSVGTLSTAVYQGRMATNKASINESTGVNEFFADSNLGGRSSDNTIGNQILNSIDDHGNNIFFYLQDFYKQLRIIAGSRRGFGKNASNSNTTSQQNIEVPVNQKALTRQSRLIGYRKAKANRFYSDIKKLGESDDDPEGRDIYDPQTETIIKASDINDPLMKNKATSRASREKAQKDSVLSNGINKLNDMISGIFFGDTVKNVKEKIKEKYGGKSLIDIIKSFPTDVADAFSKLKDKLKDKALEKWDKFKQSQWYTDFSGAFKDSIKKFGRSTLNSAKEKATNVYSFITGKVPSWAADISDTPETEVPPTAARGGFVNRSGMASVSEGEMIIPAKYNPYYKGHLSNKQREQIELENYKDWINDIGDSNSFWGFYKKGSKNLDGDSKQYRKILKKQDKRNIKLDKKVDRQDERLTEEEKDKIQQMLDDGYSIQDVARAIGKKAKKFGAYASQFTRNSLDEASNSNFVRNTKEKAKEISENVANKVDIGLNHLFGDPEKYNKTKSIVNEVFRAAKVSVPNTLAKGALGAIIGAAATGSGLGLLGGFVIGAGREILNNSEALSRKLFGEEIVDNQGNKTYRGGFLPPKVTRFIKEQLPRASKSGAIGGIIGAITGLGPIGILGGFAVGAGLELVKTTDKFKEFFFGHEGVPDENGKRHRHGGILDTIKINVVNPLIDFTKGGLTKIGDYVKKNVFDPLKNLGKSIKDWIKGATKNIVNKITDKIKGKIKTSIGQKVGSVIRGGARAVGRAGKAALKAGGAIITSPFRFMGNTVGNAIKRHNVRMGYSSLTPEERMELEGANTGGVLGGLGYINRKTGNLVGKGVNKFNTGVRNTLNGIYSFGQKHNLVKEGKESRFGLASKEKFDNWANSDFGRFKNNEYTKWASERTDSEIQEAKYVLNGKAQYDKDIRNKRKDLYRTLVASLDQNSPEYPRVYRELKKLFNTEKALEDNDYSEIYEYISKTDLLGPKTKTSALKYISDKQNEINKLVQDKENFSFDEDEFREKLKSDGLSEKQIKNFFKRGRIQSEIDANAIDRKNNILTSDAMLASIQNTISEDANDKERTEKLNEQIKENPLDDERNNILKSSRDIVEKIYGILKEKLHNSDSEEENSESSENGTSESSENNTSESSENNTSESSDTETSKDIVESVLPTASSQDTSLPVQKKTNSEENSEKEKITTKILDDGSVVEYTEVNGDTKANMADGSTQKYFKEKKESEDEKKKFFNVFTSGGLLESFKGLFGIGKKEGEEKKEGLFSKIGGFFKNIFGNANGLLSGIFGFLNGGGLVTTIIGGLKSALPTILSGIGLGILLNKLGSAAAGTSKDSGMRAGMDADARKEEVANSSTLTKIGLGANAIENTIRGRDMTTYKEDDHVSEFMTSKLAKRSLKNAVLSAVSPKQAKNITKVVGKTVGKVPVVGKLAKGILDPTNTAKKIAKKNTEIFKAVANSNVGKAIAGSKAGKLAGKAATKIKDGLMSVINFIAKKLGVKGSTEAVEATVKEGAEQIAKKGGSKLTKLLSNAGFIIKAIFIANAFTIGFQKAGAKTILGILDEPTFLERILAGALNALNEAIPGIGGIIPTEFLFTVMITILKLLGIKFNGLEEKRARAKETVAQYNQENGTTYNIEEYLANVLGEMTIQARIGKAFKGLFKKKKKTDDSSEKVLTAKDVENEEASGSGSGNSNIKNKVDSLMRVENSRNKQLAKTTGGAIILNKDKNKNALLSTNKLDIFASVKDSKQKESTNKSTTGTGSGIFDFTRSSGFNYYGGASNSSINDQINQVGSKITSTIGSEQSFNNIDNLVTSLWAFSDPTSNINGFDDTVKEQVGNLPEGSFGRNLVSAVGGIMKMAVTIVRPLKTIAALIGTDIYEATRALESGELQSAIENSEVKKTTFLDRIKNAAKSAWNWVTGNSGSGSTDPIHTSQKGNYNKFGHTTIDQNGCGPAVASTVLKAYGKNVGINSAASYAENNGYVAGASGVGTRASYFSDILGRNGIGTKYTNSNSSVRSAISSGKPVILLGQDKGNRSKAVSPFGPNPHYVVARGSDSRGNIIVDDPELGSAALYKKNILNKIKLGIMTGGASNNPRSKVKVTTNKDTNNKNKGKTQVIVPSKSDASNKDILPISSSELLPSLAKVPSSNNVININDNQTKATSHTQQENIVNSETNEKLDLTDIATLVSTITGKAFEAITKTVTDPQVKTLINWIFGIKEEKESIEKDVRTIDKSLLASTPIGIDSKAIHGNTLFDICQKLPDKNNKYIKYYNNKNNGGISECENGLPTDKDRNVLASSIGWACARFNHIYSLITGYDGMKYPGFSCGINKYIQTAQEYGLEIGTDPELGAIMVWVGGKSSSWFLGGNIGRLSIVERVDSKDQVYTSESVYGDLNKSFINETRKRGKDNNWGRDKKEYEFKGFIYNPAIHGGAINNSSENIEDEIGFIWNYLISHGFNKNAAAGILGCWKCEGATANRVEGIGLKDTNKRDTVSANVNALSQYTKTDLFNKYNWNLYKNNGELAHTAYIASSGKYKDYYLPGLGLAQWTGQRAANLLEFAENNRLNWRDTSTQLLFFEQELSKRNSDLKSKMNQASNVNDTTYLFGNFYEGGGYSKGKNAESLRKRQNAAEAVYNKYAHSTGSGSGLLRSIFNNKDYITAQTGITKRNYTAGDSAILNNINNKYDPNSEIDNLIDFVDADYPGSGSKKVAKIQKPVQMKIQNNSQNNYRKYSGGASTVLNYSSQLENLISCAKQIATNTANNASMPVLVEVMKQAISLLGTIAGKTSTNKAKLDAAKAEDFSEEISNQINLMQAKLESIAQAI